MPFTPEPQSSLNQSHSYRPDVDGLRAIAIISVVAFHTRLALFRGGYIGVDVFLVISGYLIGSLVYRDIREHKFTLVRFYERRAKRILPALLTMLVVCDLIAFALLSPLELRDYCAQAVAAVASSSNIYYWLRSNYFNPVTAFKPLLMTWSLGIEEQFYLLFPLALFLLHKFAKRRFFTVISVACLLSFVVCAATVYTYPSAAFYLLPTRAWELGLGVLIAIVEVDRGGPLKLGRARANVLGWLGLALILLPAVLYAESTRFPGVTALIPTVGTGCVIIAPKGFVNDRLLASRPMVFIGLISYSWYLWHWPLMSFARIVSGGLLSVPRAALIALFSLGLAVLWHRFIEQPFRRSHTPATHLFPRYAALMLILGAAPLVGYLHSGWPGRIPELVNAEASVRDVEKNPCLASFDDAAPRLNAPCVLEASGPKVAILGDSHAAALAPALRELVVSEGYGFEELTKASCPPLFDVTLRWSLHPTFERVCAAFNRRVLEHVTNQRDIKVVFLAGFWSAPLSKDSNQSYRDASKLASERDISEAENDSNLHFGVLNAITVLRRSGKRVVVVADVPRFDFDPMSSVRNIIIRRRGTLATLVSSHLFSLDAVPEQSLIKSTDMTADAEVRKAAQEGGAPVMDLRRNLCPASRCRFWDNGVLYYADPSHLTLAGAEYALRGQDSINLLLTKEGGR
jgi:peptidoglycan/LPS O-acetylase OafA/YrhL